MQFTFSNNTKYLPYLLKVMLLYSTVSYTQLRIRGFAFMRYINPRLT